MSVVERLDMNGDLIPQAWAPGSCLSFLSCVMHAYFV